VVVRLVSLPPAIRTNKGRIGAGSSSLEGRLVGTLVVTVTVVGIEIATKEVVAEVEAADTKVTTLTTTGRLGTTVVVDAADVVGTTVVMAGGRYNGGGGGGYNGGGGYGGGGNDGRWKEGSG